MQLLKYGRRGRTTDDPFGADVADAEPSNASDPAPPIDGYTTGKVLTMDYVSGTKVTSLSPLTRLDIDGAALAATLLRAYLKQIIVDGVFHADPHPGNVLLTDDGRIALIDLGMIGRISPTMQERLLKLLLAVTDGRGDEAADVTAAIGEKLPGVRRGRVPRDIAVMVSRYGHESLADLRSRPSVSGIASRLRANIAFARPPS